MFCGVAIPDTALTQVVVVGAVVIVKVWAADVPSPAPVLITATCALPAVTTSLDGTVAIITVGLSQTDAIALPFHTTTAVLAKFDPFRFIPTAAAPAVALAGEIELSTGMFGGGGSLTLPLPLPLEAPPPHDTLRRTAAARPAVTMESPTRRSAILRLIGI
jgi:hypothetical protein